MDGKKKEKKAKEMKLKKIFEAIKKENERLAKGKEVDKRKGEDGS